MPRKQCVHSARACQYDSVVITFAQEAKADKKEEAAAKKLQEAKVTIKRIERTKRKHITAIHGLELFGAFALASS